MNEHDQYEKDAVRTLKRKGVLEDVLHATMGMVGEIGEYGELGIHQRDQRIGEIGDCFWYAAVLAHSLNRPFSLVMEDAHLDHVPWIDTVIAACRLTDIVKKSWFYGKELPYVEVLKELVTYCSGLRNLCREMEVTVREVQDINIKKLRARYPDKYEDHLAINRDYERESLAAGVKIQ